MPPNTIKRTVWQFDLLKVAAAYLLVAYLYRMNLEGQDLAGYGLILVSVFGTATLWRGLGSFERSRRVQGVKNAMRRNDHSQGISRFATPRDVKKASLTKPGGYFLGRLKGLDLSFSGEGSLLIFGPPGSGKSTCSSILNGLIPHPDPKHPERLSSMCILDVKGEIYAVCRDALEKLKYEVVCLCPWAASMSKTLGIEIKDAGFNPLLKLKEMGDEVKDAAMGIAVLLLPGKPQMRESEEHFIRHGRDILVWGMLILVDRGDWSKLNLVEVRRLLSVKPEALIQLIEEAQKSEAFGGALCEFANKLDQLFASDREFAGAMSTAMKPLSVFDGFGPMGRHTTTTEGFRFESTKERPVAVFIIVPDDRIDTHQTWFNSTLSIGFDRMASDRSNKKVWLILDEAMNAGFIGNLLRSIDLRRSYGLSFAVYAQSCAQIERVYGKDGLRSLLSSVEVIQAFSIREIETARMLSAMAGQRTEKGWTQTINGNIDDPEDMKFSSNSSERGVPILRPEAIRELDESKTLIFKGSAPVIIADKVSYLTRRDLRKAASPNPYYRK